LTTVRALIVDDEEPARERLRALLEEHPSISVIGEAADGLAAIQSIEKSRPDLVLLDIQMPGCSGLEVVRSLTIRPLPKVLFCTAYDEYAIAAFELRALDYLVKPVVRSRLAESIQRVLADTERAEELEKRLRAAAVLSPEPGRKFLRRFLGRHARRIRLIQEQEVLYFKVDRNLVFVVTESGEYWTNYTLAEIEAEVDPAVFVRTHRQYVVNLDKVREIAPLPGGNYVLTMAGGRRVDVSRRQSRRLLDALK
jgi:two-component system LytT family response regulator